jgi:hypothetical protein
MVFKNIPQSSRHDLQSVHHSYHDAVSYPRHSPHDHSLLHSAYSTRAIAVMRPIDSQAACLAHTRNNPTIWRGRVETEVSPQVQETPLKRAENRCEVALHQVEKLWIDSIRSGGR